MRTHHLTSWVLLAGPALTTAGCGPTHLLPTRQIYQFSKPTYLQALHVRANGDMLLGTVFPNASLYYLSAPPINDPDTPPTVTTLATFAGIPSPDGTTINAITGIAETESGVFALTGGVQQTHHQPQQPQQPTPPPDPPPEPFRRVETQTPPPPPHPSLRPPLLPAHPTILLIADTSLGQILRVDTRAQTWEVILSDADAGKGSVRYPPWASLQFGVNGLTVRYAPSAAGDGEGEVGEDWGEYGEGEGGLWLYWSNSFLATVYRLWITADGYPVGGGSGKTRRPLAEKVASVRALFVDGLVSGPAPGSYSSDSSERRGKREVLWAATNVDNTVRAISDRGEVTTVAGAPDEMTVAGAVAPRFGRRPGDEHTLYVATSGGLVLPVNGTELEGGKVVGIDTRGLFKCWEE
ncbi:uncharacterized protein C8A04DRAFT_26561 [Dichotomopilus funicola]|uniref:Uncharacterized protein n=1 Tax=Dichotomopilus funicola TaxID=1934379 RepID=A0AAN6V618_9PEZI|nr:hypothetical protein C8A04DRAFT_26561 [Dichotomopilus funicola]